MQKTIVNKPKRKGYWTGKKRSVEDRAKMSAAGKLRVGTRNGFYGKLHSDATKKKMRENHRDMYGKNNPNWNGGTTDLYESIRKLKTNKAWRDSVFNRDKYTCQECGYSDGRILEAHYIISFSEILESFLEKYNMYRVDVDKGKLINLAIQHHQFWDVSNGKTLCNDCHKKTESYSRRRL